VGADVSFRLFVRSVIGLFGINVNVTHGLDRRNSMFKNELLPTFVIDKKDDEWVKSSNIPPNGHSGGHENGDQDAFLSHLIQQTI
jgi:hypothetical protein